MSNKPIRLFIYLPIALALVMVAGMFLGARMNGSPKSTGILSNIKSNRYNKLEQIINYIENEYVDTVDRDELVEEAVKDLLQQLDPHSSYIPASELMSVNESLQGNFEGIGIEFNIQKDTIMVVTPISGGPSDKLGIMPGDRIVKINNETVAGIGITNQDVINKLRGKKDTEVKVSILRRGLDSLLKFNIVRGEIPLHSLDVAYMLNDSVGYIKLNRFSATTYEEYLGAYERLRSSGMKRMVLDLRGNPGGYLTAATKLADEFLDSKKLIVYTQGKSRSRQDYIATSRGDFHNNELVILIDEGSASASEIVAGAVQDNDRGIIIGRRSFGKGLVQEQSMFPDSSAIRLTIARYYTPTGRSIQRPYENGKKAYYNELYEREVNGEMLNPDSIEVADSLKYTTPGGKVVYGGGGIMPDIFVPVDTTGYSVYLNMLVGAGIIYDYALHYADQNRSKISSYKSFKEYNNLFSVNDQILQDFVEFAKKKGVKPAPIGLEESKKIITTRLKAYIARNHWGNEGFYPVIREIDSTLIKALEVINTENPKIKLPDKSSMQELSGS